MKVAYLTCVLLAVIAISIEGKPPTAVKSSPAPTPIVPAANTTTPPGSFLRWLLEQDGGSSAIVVPLVDLLAAAASQHVADIKPGDSVDASVIAKISGALDGLLPKLNRPDGLVRQAKRLALIPPLVEDELQIALAALPGLEFTSLASTDPAALGNSALGEYPCLSLADQVSHRVYYIGITFVATGQNESATGILEIDPKSSAARITQPGTCLLIALEHNNKPGNQLAFLNWQLLNLQKANVRARMSFDGSAAEILVPSAALNDGRRGRD